VYIFFTHPYADINNSRRSPFVTFRIIQSSLRARLYAGRVLKYFAAGGDDVTRMTRCKVIREPINSAPVLRRVPRLRGHDPGQRSRKCERNGVTVRKRPGQIGLRPRRAEPRQIDAVYLCRSANRIGVALSRQSMEVRKLPSDTARVSLPRESNFLLWC
jgi:hypothetical protein